MGQGPGGGGAAGEWDKALMEEGRSGRRRWVSGTRPWGRRGDGWVGEGLGCGDRSCGSEKGSTEKNKTWTRENTLSCAGFRSNSKIRNSNASFYNFTCNKNKTRYTSCVMMAFFEFKKNRECLLCCALGATVPPSGAMQGGVLRGRGRGGGALRRRRLEASRGQEEHLDETTTRRRLSDKSTTSIPRLPDDETTTRQRLNDNQTTTKRQVK